MRASNDEDLKKKTKRKKKRGERRGVWSVRKRRTARQRRKEKERKGLDGERGWESGWAKFRTHHDVTTAIPRVLHEHSSSRRLFVSPCAWCRRSMNSIALRSDSGGGNRPQRVFQHLVMGGLSLHSDSSIDDCNSQSCACPPVVVGNHCKCTKCRPINMPS